MNAGKIFLCYRRGDSPGYAGRLEHDLERAFGRGRVFRDVEDIKGGAKWKKVLESNLAEAAAVLLIIGPRWGDIWQSRQRDGQTNYVAFELEIARERNVPVIPVTVDGGSLPADLNLGDSAWIRDNQFYDISDKQGRWSSDFDGLIRVLETMDGIGQAHEAKPLHAAGNRRTRIGLVAIGLILMLAVAAWVGLRDSADTTAQAPSATRAAGTGAVSLTAVLASGLTPADALRWEVYDIPDDELTKPNRITYGSDTEQTFELPAGRYRVRVLKGAAAAETELEVESGKRSEALLDLNAGYAQLTAVLSTDGDALEKVYWQVFDIPADALTKPNRITFGYNTEQVFVLSAGRYSVDVTSGAASVTAELEIEAGKPTTQKLNLNAGYAQLTAVLEPGGDAVDGVYWQVFDVPTQPLKTPARITFGYATEQLFVLPAGRYRILVKTKSLQAEPVIEIRAGQLTALQLTLE